MPTLVTLLLSGLILTAGDIFMKYWATHGGSNYYIAGLTIYLVGLMFFVETLKQENVAIASAILVMVNIISLIIIGWFFFHEPYSHTKLGGIILALLAILLLELGN